MSLVFNDGCKSFIVAVNGLSAGDLPIGRLTLPKEL